MACAAEASVPWHRDPRTCHWIRPLGLVASLVNLAVPKRHAKNRKNQKEEDKFVKDYKEMAQSFLDMPSKPELYIATMPPILTAKGVNKQGDLVNEKTVNLIPKIGEQLGLPKGHVVDLFSRLGGLKLDRPEFFCDG